MRPLPTQPRAEKDSIRRRSNWGISLATFDQFIASLQRDFGEQGKGKSFEVFCKWFLENDPSWSAEVDKVWLWEDYPDKWQRQDLGTDLVFRDKQGLIWAVQAKCYSEHRTTTKGDLNSFLADTGRREAHRRLWMQTTNKMEAKAEKTLKGQEKPVLSRCGMSVLRETRGRQLYELRSERWDGSHELDLCPDVVRRVPRSVPQSQFLHLGHGLPDVFQNSPLARQHIHRRCHARDKSDCLAGFR